MTQGRNIFPVALRCTCLWFIPAGTSNKAEWDKFSRQCLDKRKFPAELATHFLQSKVCLFNEWLSCGGDWNKVVLNYERKVEDKRKFKKQRKGMKARDIIAAYGETSLDDCLYWVQQIFHFKLHMSSCWIAPNCLTFPIFQESHNPTCRRPVGQRGNFS